jgi:hypothetical protein
MYRTQCMFRNHFACNEHIHERYCTYAHSWFEKWKEIPSYIAPRSRKSSLVPGCIWTHCLKTHLKVSKKIGITCSNVHQNSMFPHNFSGKILFCVLYKKVDFQCSNMSIYVTFFFFFIWAAQNVFLMRTCVQIQNVQVDKRLFPFNILNFLNPF